MDLSSTQQRRTAARFWLITFVLLMLYYLSLALSRRIDGDEGYFLYAARLVRAGSIPYRDFFFPQLPLIPYLWSGLLAPWPITWIGGRILAALIATLAALIFLVLARQQTRHRGLLAVVLLAYLSSDFGLEWAVVIKTHLPAMTLLLLGWLVACVGLSRLQAPHPRPRWRFALYGASGFCAGLALDSRLMVLPLLPLMLGAIVLGHRQARASWAGAALAWLIGLLPSPIVLAFFWHAAPYPFVYDNWFYHALGEPLSTSERWTRNLAILADRLLLNPLWLGALLLLAWERLRRRRPLMPVDWFYRLAFLVMVLVSFIPRRSYPQYYCLATPWLLLAALPAAQSWWARNGSPLWRRSRTLALTLAAVGIALLAVQPRLALDRHWPMEKIPAWSWVEQTFFKPDEINDVTREDLNSGLGMVRWVARAVNDLAPPGARLLTWWPGYAVEARTPLISGLENHFGQLAVYYDQRRLTPALKLDGYQYLDRTIAQRQAGIAVVGLWVGMHDSQGRLHETQALQRAGYRLKAVIGEAAIYTAP